MRLQTLIEKALQYEQDQETLEEKKRGHLEFLNRFPLEKLDELSVEEYANTKTKDSFIYWLERKGILSGVGGGNASKFGIYLAENGDYCKGAGKQKTVLQGDQLSEEFTILKQGIIQAIELAEEGRINENISLNLPLFNMVLLKILNIYVPERFFNVYSPSILIELGRELNIDDELLLPQQSIELNHKILTALKKQDAFANWTNEEIASFIWNTFAERDNKIDENIQYWLVGHTYENEGSIESYLLENNYIGVGFLRQDLSSHLDEEIEDFIEEKEESAAGQKALKQFFSMKEGDFVALKSTYTRKIDGKTKSVLRISAVGKITADAFDGYRFSDRYGHLLPVEWIHKDGKELVGYGGYRRTINKAKDNSVISLVFIEGADIEDQPETFDPEADHAPKNYVLYGPPGTGKTYQFVDRALEIVDKKTFEELEADGREALQQYFSQLTREGSIHLVTFHQSYAYEDFIEGLKSDGEGNFVPSDGILKRAAIEAMYEGIQLAEHGYSEEVHFEQLYDYLVKNGMEHQVIFESKTGSISFISHISPNKNIVVTSEGAKSSSIVSKARLLEVYRYIRRKDIDWKNSVSFVREAIGGSNQTWYWSVLNWIMRKMEEEAEEQSIEIDDNEKSAIVQKALRENGSFDFTNAKRHIVIIDEMNRGNISKIFGELLTLLEEDKRLTERNEIVVELPYSKEKFALPPNLYMIGTMNTADRSIALLDTALRRRFAFEEIMPNPDLLESVGNEIDVITMLTIMNHRIEVLYDRDHMIGHAYFINAKTDEEVIDIMQRKVIPLLQEYFYDDWEKIGLVLGGIGTSREDAYIVYKEEVDINQLFKDRPSIHVPELYRLKQKLSTQELISIYDENHHSS
ncbi:AAA family ATPase [Virgibacillus oceani]